MSVAPQSLERAQRIAAAIAELPGIVAVSLGGSTSAGLAEETSDLDLHVYWRGALAAAEERVSRIKQVAEPGSVDVDVRYWGLEDHLRVDGQFAELIYVRLDELQTDVARAYGEGISGEGYVTAQFFYVANGVLIHDPTGELEALRVQLMKSYPEPTRQLLLRDNPFLLRFYLRHLRQAQRQNDLLFVQHRRYTLQMVFFNLLFALNRRYHPGEKRLLTHGEQCAARPRDLAARWVQSAQLPADDMALSDQLEELVEELCALAEAEQ